MFKIVSDGYYDLPKLPGTHYSAAFSPQLADMGIAFADKIWEMTEGKPERLALFYTGMSGISFATAIVVAQQIGYSKKSSQLYIRKENEKSHGYEIEASYIGDKEGNYSDRITRFFECDVFAFVDDLCSSGRTYRFCIDQLIKEKYLSSNPKIIAFLQRGSWDIDYVDRNLVTIPKYSIPQSSIFFPVKK